MAVVAETVNPTLQAILAILQSPWWAHPDFVVSTIIGVVGVFFSIAAFSEARAAKRAAKAAGKFVRTRMIAMELVELSLQLGPIDPQITYPSASELISSASAKLMRILAPLKADADLKDTVDKLNTAMGAATAALVSVRPAPETPEVTGATYLALEDPLRNLRNAVAELAGLTEDRTDGHP